MGFVLIEAARDQGKIYTDTTPSVSVDPRCGSAIDTSSCWGDGCHGGAQVAQRVSQLSHGVRGSGPLSGGVDDS